MTFPFSSILKNLFTFANIEIEQKWMHTKLYIQKM
jgi:hypothetical protein